jgi:hypothetical protein
VFHFLFLPLLAFPGLRGTPRRLQFQHYLSDYSVFHLFMSLAAEAFSF